MLLGYAQVYTLQWAKSYITKQKALDKRRALQEEATGRVEVGGYGSESHDTGSDLFASACGSSPWASLGRYWVVNTVLMAVGWSVVVSGRQFAAAAAGSVAIDGVCVPSESTVFRVGGGLDGLWKLQTTMLRRGEAAACRGRNTDSELCRALRISSTDESSSWTPAGRMGSEHVLSHVGFEGLTARHMQQAVWAQSGREGTVVPMPACLIASWGHRVLVHERSLEQVAASRADLMKAMKQSDNPQWFQRALDKLDRHEAQLQASQKGLGSDVVDTSMRFQVAIPPLLDETGWVLARNNSRMYRRSL